MLSLWHMTNSGGGVLDWSAGDTSAVHTESMACVQVSDVLAGKFGASQKAEQPGKSAQAGPPPLQELFSVGQLVRCSILALHDKDSSNGVPN